MVVKVPRFAFEKFPAADAELTTTMKSVGEAMAIGRNYSTALQKALRSLEKRGSSFHWGPESRSVDELLETSRTPTDGRIVTVQQALRAGATAEQVFDATKIDPWFIDQIVLINEVADAVRDADELDAETLREAKDHGFSDAQIAEIRGLVEQEVRDARHAADIRPVYKTVDTCAGEFPALTPYHYSSYDSETEIVPSDRRKVIILGSGPNRIGQGIEFDYSCVHASFALADAGYETIMINCNPETVSTDYDTSDRLYFEPLTLEDVLEIVHVEQQAGELVGVVVQLGGQTALGLAKGLEAAGVPILGTSPSAIDLAEERGRFSGILDTAGLVAPRNGTAVAIDEAVVVAEGIGYPVLVRPSYVLGGRGMEIVFDTATLHDYFLRMADQGIIGEGKPLLIDRFLDDAIEIDIDAIYDGTELYVGGVMEHIEEAGIHSGDSSCTLPPGTLGRGQIQQVVDAARAIAEGVGVRGLLNLQFAIGAGVLYVLEANPRASRTVPFVSKALGIPLAKAASLVMVGTSIAELKASGLLPERDGSDVPMDSPVAVKEAVLPFKRFRTKDGLIVDSVLGPEMRSTGEVMGIDRDFPRAFAKSQEAAFGGLPLSGTVFVSVADRDKRSIVLPVLRLQQLGFEVLATARTAEILSRNGIQARVVRKYSEAARRGRLAVDSRPDQPRRGGRRHQHPVGPHGARGRLRDPRGGRRGRQGAVHDHRAAHGRGRVLRRHPRGLRRDEPAGLRDRPRGPQVTSADGGAVPDAPSFGARLARTFRAHGHLCVGIDPHRSLLDAWGLADDARGLEEFGLRVVEATAGRAGIVKPPVAFFERHGSAGYAALERVLAAARDAGLLVIADAKRGDIGSTVDAYGAAWLAPDSPLRADAVTLTAYTGVGSLDGVRAAADAWGAGVFVLAATSNPEARDLQRAVLPTAAGSAARTVARGIQDAAVAANGPLHDPTADPGSFGLVVGATVDAADAGLDLARLVRTPILAPGFGHQGALLGDVRKLFGPAAGVVIAAASRSILTAGPRRVAEAVTDHAGRLEEVLP